ncbi:MAG: hypothetical protein AB7O49_17250 [Sphingomonadales bacterium]
MLAGTYDLNVQFFNFSPGSAVPGAVVSDATFEWTTASVNVSGGDQQAILEHASGSITTADWCDGATLVGLNVWGEIPSSGFQANSQTYQVSLNATALATIQTLVRAGSTIGFIVVAQAQIDGVAPIGNDRYDILSDDDSSAANRPALIVTYSTDIEISVPVILIGSSNPVPGVSLGAVVALPKGAGFLVGVAPIVAASSAINVPSAVMGSVALSLVRAGPLWRAVNENQVDWQDRAPSVAAWTPASSA